MKHNIQFISNYQSEISHYDQIRQVIEGGIKWVQYRPKEMDINLALEEGRRIAQLCAKNNATLIINDNVELAQVLDADGVHLGKSDLCPLKARAILGANKIIGGTANTFEDILDLLEKGCNYVGLGPYKFTNTKKNLSPIVGLEGYAKICNQLSLAQVNIDLVAIGGVKTEDIPLLLNVGIENIAVSSLLSEAKNIKVASRQLTNHYIK